jgi:endo-1,4-beta-xylanase
VANEIHAGAGAIKVTVPTAYPGSQWNVQLSSAAFATTVGKQYAISYWVKAASAGGPIRLSTGPGATNAQYQGDQVIGTAWQQVTWTITANIASTTILFDMAQVANTYFLDDVSVRELGGSTVTPQVAAKVDRALGSFITGMVNHYKGKVKAWDVVNELFAENGNIRNNTNTPTSASDVFVWSEYLGRDYALKAFNYAKAADPSALLFINDYNLELNNAKLDSLIAFVAELTTKGAKVDGIGTQMHMIWNASTANIDNMMRKLAATGLLIRISELDVRMNPLSTAGYTLTTEEATKEANLYKYIVKSYMTNIPKAQQHGITVWGLSDNTSWYYNNGKDFPLLYNSDYSKKAAYNAVLDALKGK